MNKVNEIACVWFETAGVWHAVADCGLVLGTGPSVGAAFGQALDVLGLGEADFGAAVDRGDFYMFVRDCERVRDAD